MDARFFFSQTGYNSNLSVLLVMSTALDVRGFGNI